jgi:hypothetical protein
MSEEPRKSQGSQDEGQPSKGSFFAGKIEPGSPSKRKRDPSKPLGDNFEDTDVDESSRKTTKRPTKDPSDVGISGTRKLRENGYRVDIRLPRKSKCDPLITSRWRMR